MKEKQLDRLAKILDRGNAIREAINDLELSLKLLNKNSRTRVSIAVINNEDVIAISDHFSFWKNIWVEIIIAEIRRLRKDFKRLRI